jgi:hypothetical protein
MEVLNRDDQFGSIESRLLFIETARSSQVEEEFTTVDEVHN